MKLKFIPYNRHPVDGPRGFWRAETDNEIYRGEGSDPLSAITELAQQLEEELSIWASPKA